MNRYFLIRRLRGPAFLILLGVVFLLHKLGVVEHTWNFLWPLALILLGVLMLAERAALHAADEPPQPFPGSAPASESQSAPLQPAIVPTAILPPHNEGGQQ